MIHLLNLTLTLALTLPRIRGEIHDTSLRHDSIDEIFLFQSGCILLNDFHRINILSLDLPHQKYLQLWL